MEGVENISEIEIKENEIETPEIKVEDVKPVDEMPVLDTVIQPDTFKNGQHKKKCQCADCQAKRLAEQSQPVNKEVAPQATASNSVEENPELSGFEDVEPEQNESEPAREEKKRKITGAMFLMGLEIIFPLLLKYVVGFLEPKFKRLNKAGKKALELSDDIIEELMPYADDLAEEIFGELPSWVGFTLLYTGAKFMLVEELDDKLHFNPK